ncbi:MAG: hypothetical protein ACLQIB_33025 [Isosphaeraceae bacterium]
MNTRLPEIARDAAIVAGTASLAYGCWLLWRPLGFMLVGITLMAFAVLWEFDRQRRKPRSDGERNRPTREL